MDKKSMIDVAYSVTEGAVEVAGFFCLLDRVSEIESTPLRFVLLIALVAFTTWGFSRATKRVMVVFRG